MSVKRLALLAFFLILIFFASSAPAQTAGVSSLAFTRAQRLKRGINLSDWFAQVWDKRGYTKEHFDTWTTAEDIALIKSLGFDHVRLCVNPQPMWIRSQPNKLPAEYLGYLDAALKMILDHGLAVVIDMHPDSDFKQHLASDDVFVQQFADFWQALAQHYSSWDADRVFFEILNEPEMRDRYRWSGAQVQIAAAIRAAAPNHTIIAAGARWSDNDDLLFTEPLRDPNVIYNFHFYEPHIFTHQGATWAEYDWHWLHGLHYPSTPESAANVASQVPNESDRLHVLRYGFEHWDPARMEMEMKQAADWARSRSVPLTCNEFGVFRNFSVPQDRAAWLHDVRVALEHNGIGWAMWDYSGGFGVVTKENGKAVPDENVLRALGMK